MCMFALSTSSTYGALVVDKPLVRGHRSPHGQNWLTGAQMAYKDTTKQALCNALGSYYSDVEQQTMFENTRVAFEFPKKVSQEAVADMIEQHRKNGNLAATRIYEAREFINALLDSGVCLDEEEAMEVLATWCSASHSLFKGWTFCQSLTVLRMAFVAYANEHKIEDIFCEAVLDELDDGMKALFESTAVTALVNTNNEAVSKEGVFARLASQHNGLQRHRNELARIKSEEDAKLDDLTYLALTLATHCDINNLHKDELTRELFKETNAQAVFDTMLESYNDNKDLLKAKLMIATPEIPSDARNWSTFIAEGVRELESTGLVGIRNIEGKIFIRSTKGKFAGSKWKNCTIMYINGKRYDSYKNGMDLLKEAKNSNTITLTVLLSG